MKNNLHRMELLAPAGNLETAVAALQAGADAVYLGLGKFNARSRAENFKPHDLARLLEFAHRNNQKVYLTLNTLIKESELPELLTALGEIAKLNPDAVIVQDLGVLYIIRRYFPQITVHASTQMNIHNSCGIKLLEKLGVKRVILERQITLEELKKIAAATSMELEVFIHGSQCISLSGRCLLSNYAENASGNRGMCRQLCRRIYRTGADAPLKAALSPMDMQCMELLPELQKLNITSLKIEGRLRGPDYVVPVVKAYRKAIDELPQISSEALNMIRRTISRPAGNGAYPGFGKLLQSEPQAVFGCNVGAIKSANSSGMFVKLSGRIHLGDKLRIVDRNNGSLAGFELTTILLDQKKVSAANGGKTVFIPGKFPFMEGENHLYKIGENGYDCKRLAASLPEPCRKIALDIVLDSEGLHAASRDFPEFEFHSESFAPAQKCSVSQDDLQSVFNFNEENYRLETSSIRVEGQWFIAKSVLKELRRELLTALLPEIRAMEKRPENSHKAMLRFQSEYRAQQAAEHRTDLPENTLHIPGFIAEGDLNIWRKKIAEASKRGTVNFAIGNIHGIMLIKEALKKLDGVNIYTVYPLPAANSQAVKLLQFLQAKAVMPWVELPQDEQEKLFQNSVLPLLELPEDCELLATRVPL
ncbi:MAG: U32 family peptidase, partial [Lentisphaeria bacterium]|nr:U32 family peptidase [Lentisphaeria bacterium]